MMHLILKIDIHGDVDQTGLNRLRTHLDLKKQGRLTDDWDQQFGYRKIERPGGQYTKIVLYRDFDGSWEVQVIDTEKPIPMQTNSQSCDASSSEELKQQDIKQR
jgi:hypothetical protein